MVDGDDKAKKMQFDPEILQRMIDAPHFLAKPRSGRSLLLSNMAQRKAPTKKREFKVKVDPKDFAANAKRPLGNQNPKTPKRILKINIEINVNLTNEMYKTR